MLSCRRGSFLRPDEPGPFLSASYSLPLVPKRRQMPAGRRGVGLVLASKVREVIKVRNEDLAGWEPGMVRPVF